MSKKEYVLLSTRVPSKDMTDEEIKFIRIGLNKSKSRSAFLRKCIKKARLYEQTENLANDLVDRILEERNVVINKNNDQTNNLKDQELTRLKETNKKLKEENKKLKDSLFSSLENLIN